MLMLMLFTRYAMPSLLRFRQMLIIADYCRHFHFLPDIFAAFAATRCLRHYFADALFC